MIVGCLILTLAGCATKPVPFKANNSNATVLLNYTQRGATIDGSSGMVWQRHPFKGKSGALGMRPSGRLQVFQIPPGRYVLRRVNLNSNWRGVGDFHLVTRQPYYAEFTVREGDVRYLGDFTVGGDANFYENPVMQQNGGDPLANALAMMIVGGITTAIADPFTPADVRIALRHDLPAVLEELQKRYSNFANSPLRRIKHQPPLLGYWAIDNIAEKEEPDQLSSAIRR